MEGLLNIFTNKLEEFFSHGILPKKIAVAVSGGADSLALTLLLQQFCLTKKIKLLAITVDHKMRQSSSNEALALGKILKKQKISHQILEISSLENIASNAEAKMREARYELLHQFCLKEKIEFLFLGHHLGDVAENFLIRLFRGSGLDGLSTISEVADFKKIKLVRPLLDVDKSELINFLQSQKIQWFEDESNEDEKFLRNKIRKFFESFPEKNLIQKRIKNASDEISGMRDFFDDLMLKEASQILTLDPSGYFLIDHKNLKKTNEKFALKILALAAMEVSGKNYKPRLRDLKSFYKFLIENEKIKRRDFYGCFIEQHDGKLLALKPQKIRKDFELRTVLRACI